MHLAALQAKDQVQGGAVKCGQVCLLIDGAATSRQRKVFAALQMGQLGPKVLEGGRGEGVDALRATHEELHVHRFEREQPFAQEDQVEKGGGS